MKVKSGLFTDIRGSMGGATASNWKGLMILKKKPEPTNPQTAQQLVQRGYMASSVTAWQGLKGVKKQAYRRMSGLMSTAMSGFNLWCARYLDASRAGTTLPSATEITNVIETTGSVAIEGALVRVLKTGTTQEVYRGYSDSSGELAYACTVEDEEYDIIISATGYVTKEVLSQTCAQLDDTYQLTAA